MSRVLVTGGQGFIGAHLAAALLERGDEVTVLDRRSRDDSGGSLRALGLERRVEYLKADLAAAAGASDRDPGTGRSESTDGRQLATQLQGIDSVFHLAAQTLVGPAMADPAATFEANVAGTWNLLEACRHAAVGRVVVASSDKAYGPSEALPYVESQPLAPRHPYEASKAACDLIARSYASSFGLPVAVTRLANVYGGGDLNYSRLVPELISAALRGEPAAIRSDGSPERDFIHVSDAVAAYLAIERLLAEGRGAGEAFNAGTGTPVAVRTVIEKVAALAGPGVEAEHEHAGSPPGEIDRQFVDSSRLQALTGWQPRTGLDEGLREAYDWYRCRAPSSIS